MALLLSHIRPSYGITLGLATSLTRFLSRFLSASKSLFKRLLLIVSVKVKLAFSTLNHTVKQGLHHDGLEGIQSVSPIPTVALLCVPNVSDGVTSLHRSTPDDHIHAGHQVFSELLGDARDVPASLNPILSDEAHMTGKVPIQTHDLIRLIGPHSVVIPLIVIGIDL